MDKKLTVGTVSLGVYFYDRFCDMIELNGGTVVTNVRSCIIRYVSDLWDKKYVKILEYTAAEYGMTPEEWQRRRKEGTLDEAVGDGKVGMSLPLSTYELLKERAESSNLSVEQYLLSLVPPKS